MGREAAMTATHNPSRAYRFVSSSAELASARGWGPGWPNPDESRWTTISVATTLAGNDSGQWSTPGHQTLTVRRETADLWTLLLGEVQRRGYHLVSGWCWSGENRPIGGTSTPSNHSWALAVDLNAPTNPMTFDNSVHTDMPAFMPDLFARYGFRWGGDYYSTSRRDAMHYEFIGTVEDAGKATAAAHAELATASKIAAAKAPAPKAPSNPHGPPGPHGYPGWTMKAGTSGPHIAAWQAKAGGLTADGQFGPATLARVRAYQRVNGLTVTGVLGVKTWPLPWDGKRP